MEKSQNLQKLDALIPEFAEFKAEADVAKKLADGVNAQIKAIMDNLALQNYEVGDYKVTYSVQDRSTMNEELLLSLGHKFNALKSCVKKKEYFDFDALEKLIYDGQIPNFIMEEIAKAKEEKFVEILKLSKVKEKK